MVVHKTWYSILTILLALIFIFPALATVFSPESIIPSLLSGFDLDPIQMEAFQFAFLGNNIRNIVISAFIIYFALKDTRTLLVLLVMRFSIEFFDLIGGLIWNPAIMEVLPVFLFMFVLELFLIFKGVAFIRSRE